MSDLLYKSLLYGLVTNNYIVPNIPLLFGKFPGDPFYPILKNLFFFLFIFLITFFIFRSHNSNLDMFKLKSTTDAPDINSTTLNDSLTILIVVLTLYFLISLFITPIQLIKLEYDSTFNTIFFILFFAVVSFIYAIITDRNIKYKTVSNGKNNVMMIIVGILFFLYSMYDEQLSGSIPGLSLIPTDIRKLLNLSIKISTLTDNAEFTDNLREKLSSILNDTQFDKFMNLIKVALSILPKPARMIINSFKSKTKILDKLLGTVDLNNISQLNKIIDSPLIKLLLIV